VLPSFIVPFRDKQVILPIDPRLYWMCVDPTTGQKTSVPRQKPGVTGSGDGIFKFSPAQRLEVNTVMPNWFHFSATGESSPFLGGRKEGWEPAEFVVDAVLGQIPKRVKLVAYISSEKREEKRHSDHP